MLPPLGSICTCSSCINIYTGIGHYSLVNIRRYISLRYYLFSYKLNPNWTVYMNKHVASYKYNSTSTMAIYRYLVDADVRVQCWSLEINRTTISPSSVTGLMYCFCWLTGMWRSVMWLLRNNCSHIYHHAINPFDIYTIWPVVVSCQVVINCRPF